ncbi:armadillo repeat-containing protein 10 [Corythoichthys intestinalis]|uniref:armadillo repeat-containing protein 10 n=1 Tax=Corythoichthys intestinalis TaxID=161448 RepID=UPI0025A5F76E|nr:armadillo repeat-containing protein 10 [Corythoichthys intestinalis]XP_061812329.1 armadillo repeat-containing protein 10-like [Nerophis lumbriciformis]
MGDGGSITPRIGTMKTLLGLIAGAGASYVIYKLISGGSLRRYKKSGRHAVAASKDNDDNSVRPDSLLAKVSGLEVVCPPKSDDSYDLIQQSAGDLEPHHLKLLLTSLKNSNSTPCKCRLLVTLGNAAAFTVNQNVIRECDGIAVIGGFLSDSAQEVKVQALNVLNNLCVNTQNQEELKVYVPQVLELIEMSSVNSDLQLGALRLLTNLSVTDKHHHMLKDSVTLLLSLLVVGNASLQVQTLKVLVNLSSNPDIMDDIVQAQAPASVMLLFDVQTASPVLLRLLTFAGNLQAWRPSAQVAKELRLKHDCLFRVMLDESSELNRRLVDLLSHPDREIQGQVARILT